MNTETPKKNSRKNSPTIISNRGQILATFKQMQEKLTLLTCQTVQNKMVASTILLEINERKKFLILDEFRSDNTAFNTLEAGTPLEIFAKVQGIETSFRANIVKIVQQNESHLYYTTLPDKLLRHQKRSALRVPLISQIEGRITLFRADGPALLGTLHDLSATGFGGLVSADSELATGVHYPCMLELGFRAPINATIEIRFVGGQTIGRQRRFGAYFISINSNDTRQIGKTILEIQRELIRKGVGEQIR